MQFARSPWTDLPDYRNDQTEADRKVLTSNTRPAPPAKLLRLQDRQGAQGSREDGMGESVRVAVETQRRLRPKLYPVDPKNKIRATPTRQYSLITISTVQ